MMQFLHPIQSFKNVQSTHKNLKADNSKKISGSIGSLVFYRLYQGIVCRPLCRVLFIGNGDAVPLCAFIDALLFLFLYSIK